jgi:hypothetical protein
VTTTTYNHRCFADSLLHKPKAAATHLGCLQADAAVGATDYGHLVEGGRQGKAVIKRVGGVCGAVGAYATLQFRLGTAWR